MGSEQKPRLTDYQTFWKLVLLVVVAVLAEGALLLASVNETAIDWVAGNEVYNPKHEAVAQDVDTGSVDTEIVE